MLFPHAIRVDLSADSLHNVINTEAVNRWIRKLMPLDTMASAPNISCTLTLPFVYIYVPCFVIFYTIS